MTATIMPRARLLILNGFGHGTFLTSSCTAQAVERYLVEVALPAPGTVREPDFQPFDVPPTASAGTRGAERRRFLSGPLTPRDRGQLPGGIARSPMSACGPPDSAGLNGCKRSRPRAS